MNKRTTIAIPKELYVDMKHIILDLDISAAELFKELFYDRYEELKRRVEEKKNNNHGEEESDFSQGMQKV